MLTRLFSHSKPIAFAILCIVFAVAFFIENFLSTKIDLKPSLVFNKIGILIVFLLILFLLNFIVKRNKIHHQHTYAVSSFTLLVIAFPEVLRSVDFVMAFFFLLMSLRRILSLKTNTNIKQKIFDSSLLLYISICFESFHWLFLILIYLGVIMYASQNYRHFMIPFLGLAVGFVIHLSYFLIFEDKWIEWNNYFLSSNGVDSFFDSFKYGSLLGLLLVILTWVIFQLPNIYNKSKLHVRESLSMILFFILISMAVIIFNTLPLSVDAIYLIWPLSILIGSYLQLQTTKKWMIEVFYIVILFGVVFSAIY